MFKSKFISIFLLLLFIATSSDIAAAQETKTFQGQVSITNGALSNDEEFSIVLELVDPMGFSGGSILSQAFIYSDIQPSYDYDLQVTRQQYDDFGFGGGSFRIYLECSGCSGLLNRTYLADSPELQAAFEFNGRQFSGFDIEPSTETFSGLDFSALQGETLTGNFQLPMNLAPDSGEFLEASVQIYDSTGLPLSMDSFQQWSSSIIPFDSTDSFVPFSIQVPTLPANFFYSLSYSCLTCSTNLVPFGFYAPPGATTGSFEDQLFGDLSQTIILEVLEAGLISGVMSRPAGIDQSLSFFVNLCFESVEQFASSGCVSASFEQDSATAAFSITFPKAQYPDGLILRYDCMGLCPEGPSPTGFYSSAGTVGARDLAEIISSDGEQGIVFPLAEAVQFTGTLSLPNGAMASETLFANMFIEDDIGGFFSSSVEIAAGQNSGTFSVSLAALQGNFRISYSCSNCPDVVSQGFYDGVGFSTNRFNELVVSDLGTLQGITLEMIQGVTIAGTISLPEGQMASGAVFGNLQISETAGNFNSYFAGFDIGMDPMAVSPDSTEFSVTVPADAQGPLRLSYSCFGCADILEQGFYDGVDFVVGFDAALDVQDISELSGLDLELIAGITISTSLKLPNDSVAQDDLFPGISFSTANGGFFFAGSFIGAGMDTASFFITLPADGTALRYQYDCFGCGDAGEQGFFDGVEFSSDIADAVDITDLSVVQDQTFTMLQPFTLNGILRLPNGVLATSDVVARVEISDPVQGTFTADVIIPENENSAIFEFDATVPRFAFDNFIMRYFCDDCSGVLPSGTFDGVGGFTVDPNQSFVGFDLSEFDDKDLTMIPAVPVSGFIELPGDQVASTDITVAVSVSDNNGFYSTEAIILGGESQGAFTLEVPSVTGNYRLEYACFGCDNVFPTGFYTTQGTTASFFQAENITNLNDALSTPFVLAPAFSISGSITRPEGFDLTEEITIFINVSGLDENGFQSDFIGSQPVTIPAGAPSAEFDILAPQGQSNGFALDYFCQSCPDGVFGNGSYQPGGTTLGQGTAGVSEGDINEPFDFPLLATSTVSGTLSLPLGLSPDSQTEVFVDAVLRDSEGAFLSSSGDFVLIAGVPEPQDPVAFSFEVPQIAGASVTLEYSCLSCDLFISPSAFFSESGSSEFVEDAQQFAIDDSITDINFELLESAVISGTISRPDDQPLDQELNLQLAARADTAPAGFGRSIFLTIPADVTEVPYQIPVPRNTELFVTYFCFDCDGIWRVGHYSDTGTVVPLSEKTVLDSGLNGFDNIDIPMVRSLAISGELSRHGGDTNTDEVLPNVLIDVVTEDGELDQDFMLFGFGQQLLIAENETSAAFEIMVPEIASGGYQVRYDCPAGCGQDTFAQGFYSAADSNAVFDMESALALTPADTLEDINFSMLAGRTIFGNVSRPISSGDSVVFEPVVTATVLSDNSEEISTLASFSPTTIPVLSVSTPYSITLPAINDISVRVEYECLECDEVFPIGFHGSTQTEYSIEEARELDAQLDDLSNISLELLASTVVGGTLDRADPSNNDEGLLAFLTITPIDDDGNTTNNVFPSDTIPPDLVNTQSFSATIPALSSSLAYSITIPARVADEGFKLNYDCLDCEVIKDVGYFNSAGTVGSLDDAETVISTGALDLLNLAVELLEDNDNDEIANIEDNCADVANADQANFDQDEFGDVCDVDIDGDNANNDVDSDSNNPLVCSDSDNDSCDDCSNGAFNVADDGLDTDSDGMCDVGDTDDDGDLAPDSADCAPLDNTIFQLLNGFVDSDGDTIGTGAAQSICTGAVLPVGFAPLLTDDNCPNTPNTDQANFDGDDFGDVCDSDQDNDSVENSEDSTPFNPLACGDSDNDQCDDCSSGTFNVNADGDDLDSDGLCDVGDPDIDGDSVDNAPDNCPLIPNSDQANLDQDLFGDVCDTDIDGDNANNNVDSDSANPLVCSDSDNDSCEDCSSGVFNVADDGLDTDLNGICNIGDPDDDGDLALDSVDCSPLDGTIFQFIDGFVDVDEDNVGTGVAQSVCSGDSLPAGFAPLLTDDNCPNTSNANQANFDGDSFGDACDLDSDNDLVDDAEDLSPFNPLACRDTDNDQCDDCSSGTFNVNADGDDDDRDGLCNIGDPDIDGDGVDNELDNCPLTSNPLQEDTDGDGVGDACGELCFPVPTKNGALAVICL